MAKVKKASRKPTAKMPRITVSFPENVQEELNRIAARKKVSVGWVVREAVEKYLAADNPLFHELT